MGLGAGGKGLGTGPGTRPADAEAAEAGMHRPDGAWYIMPSGQGEPIMEPYIASHGGEGWANLAVTEPTPVIF